MKKKTRPAATDAHLFQARMAAINLARSDEKQQARLAYRVVVVTYAYSTRARTRGARRTQRVSSLRPLPLDMLTRRNDRSTTVKVGEGGGRKDNRCTRNSPRELARIRASGRREDGEDGGEEEEGNIAWKISAGNPPDGEKRDDDRPG